MDSGGFHSAHKHESETRDVSEPDANESSQGAYTSAVNWAKTAEEEEGIPSDADNSHTNQLKVIIDILRERLNESLDREKVRLGMNCTLLPFLKRCNQVVFKSGVHTLVYFVSESRLLNDPSHDD